MWFDCFAVFGGIDFSSALFASSSFSFALFTGTGLGLAAFAFAVTGFVQRTISPACQGIKKELAFATSAVPTAGSAGLAVSTLM